MLELLPQHESALFFGVLFGAFCLIALAEMIAPRRRLQPSLGFRWLNNIALAIVTTLCNRAFYLATGLTTSWWLNQQHFGLVSWLDLGWPAAFLVSLLLLGLADYLVHRLMHAVPMLWRLHAVHHSDTEFDLTTTYRNHPFAALFLLLMRLPVIVILGAPASVLVMYECIRLAQNLWSHSNTRLPASVDRLLRYFIVTPDFHRVHHCSEQRYTNSNFSSTVPWFDYLFGTYRARHFEEHDDMEIGLERLRERRDSRLDQLLLMPLRVK